MNKPSSIPTSTQPPELLAPAGEWEALRAAVANGADAVYFGLEDFNARRRAENFTLADLPDVMQYLHEHNTRGYVTFNTLIFSDELPRAQQFAAGIAAAGADAVIVQDLGLLRLIRRLAPSLPVHASTQMTQTEPLGIEMLRSLGASRVILARELSLEELAAIRKATPMPLEVFVHGALCISYSGQCLASESLWQRSANRGECGQACRLPYELIVDGEPRDLGERSYLLSAQDLAAHEHIARLVELGVAAFKIEGRLKSAHYVAAATRIYRAAIDAALRHEQFRITLEQQEDLAQSFSRGSAGGYLDGLNHQALVHGRFPKHRGVRAGTVVGTTRDSILVEVIPPATLKPGDGVVFDEGHPDQDEQGGRIYEITPRGAGRFQLAFGRGDVNLTAVAIGSIVWKTDDPAIRRRLESSYSRVEVARRVPLHLTIRGAVNQSLEAVLRDDDGREIRIASAAPLEQARKHPLTAELVREQFSRLGDTPYELAFVELIGEHGPAESLPVMAPKSVLNDLRRQAVTLLTEQRAGSRRHEIREPDALEALRKTIESQPSETAANLCVLARTIEQFRALLESPAALSMIYGDFADLKDYAKAAEAARAVRRPFGLALPHILHVHEDKLLDTITAASPDVVLVRNLGSLQYLRQRHSNLAMVGDFSLNVANEITAAVLTEMPLVRLTPSNDANWPQLNEWLRHYPADRLEVVVHQHMPMFHIRHCLYAAHLSEGRDCSDCGRPCSQHSVRLRDRNGVENPVIADVGGRNTIFNAIVQTAADHIPALRQAGATWFRIELLEESPADMADLLDLYTGLLHDTVEPTEASDRLRTLYPAGLTRGTWQA